VQWRHLDAACDTLWRAREKLLPPETAGDHSTERAALCSDLTDLVAAWAGLRIAQAAGDQSATAQAEARRQLDEAQALCGRSFTIDLARHEYFPDASAGREAASFPQPQTARDHYALGRFLLRADKLDEAREQFERAMALEPGTFWPYFYLSLCAHKQHDFERALRAADVCVALMPNSAPCFYNRALCYESLDRADEALADLNRAVALDPSLAVGWLRRGVLQAARRHFAEATTSFTTALERGANPADVYYQLALVDVAERNRDAALAHLRLALQHDAGNAPAVALKAQLESAP